MKATTNDSASADLRQLHVDVLRGRNYPQTEDDPCACTTFLRLFFFDGLLKESIADMFTTEVHENTNAPFYNTGVDIELPTGLESVGLVIEVMETTRQNSAYVLFYGSIILSLAIKGKREETVALTNINPRDNPDAVAQGGSSAPAAISTSSPVIGIRYHVFRPKVEGVKDVHADVVLPSIPVFTGSCCLVPKDSQYVWVSLLSDARWVEAFRYALVREWQGRPSLLPTVPVTKKFSGSTSLASVSGKKDGTPRQLMSPKSPKRHELMTDVNSIGDVILKRWCCCRSHEVLTRLVICAEAFSRREGSLFFSRERELTFRLKRKERVQIMKEIAHSSLHKTGKSELRDTIDSMWIFFAIGVRHDTSGTRVLSYEARKKVRETGFDDEDKMVLQSSLLNFLIPSLGINNCVAIAAADLNNAEQTGLDDMGSRSPASLCSLKNNPMAPPVAEIDFAMALVEYIGPLLDTLTESEMVMAFKAFDPALVDARQRIKDGCKEEVKRARSRTRERSNGTGRFEYKPGGGIKIAHLDILGRRKKEIKKR